MNWVAAQSVSTEGMLQAGLPLLEIFCAFVAIVAILMFLAVALYTIFATRSSSAHLSFHQLGETKLRVDRVPSTTPARIR